jgi:hypothetical protein
MVSWRTWLVRLIWVEPLARGFRKRDANGDLPVGQREFRAILVDLAQCRDADRLAERLRRHAELRREREARANDDLGALKIALDTRRPDFLHAGHLGKQPVADIFELLRVVAAERDRDVAAAAAAAAMLRLEVDSGIGNLR